MGIVTDWMIMNVAPEWIVLATVSAAWALMLILFLGLVVWTRAPRRREPAQRAAEPAARVRGLRVPPYVHEARHRATEPVSGRDVPWPGRLR